MMLSLRQRLFAATTALTLLSVGPLSAQRPATEGSPATPALTVSAEASVTVAPDRAEVGIAVESRSKTAAQASSDNARIQTAILDALRRLGVTGASVQTRAVQVNPEFEYPRDGGRPTVVGYIALNELQVSLRDLSKVGPVVDAVIAQGATRISGPRFLLADADSARREALDIAVRRALGDAQVMARAAGMRLGPVLEISNASSPSVLEFARPAAMMRASADAAPTPVETGTISVGASVQVRIAILP